jgi:hypothetical protein
MTPEGAILKQIMDWLAAKHVLAFRMNTGGMRYGENRLMRFGVPGMADILAFPHHIGRRLGLMPGEDFATVEVVVPCWIECKAAKGKQSALQASFQAQVEGEGHRYVLARSVDDVEAALR